MTYSVYVFLDARNRPYYVGKTNNMIRRRKEHVEEILNGNSLPKYTRARKLMQMGERFKMRRIITAKTEAEAFKLERQHILKYRRMGYVLMNCTYGGPDEKPMKINNLKNPNPKGITLPSESRPKKPKGGVKKVKSKWKRKVR